MLTKSDSSLNANWLKGIAIAAMTIDHIAWLLIPLPTVWGQLAHMIGRLTAPIMCFFVAEGYYLTRDLKKYFLRLAAFALLSHLPFVYYMTGTLSLISETGVIFTLLLGLTALTAAKSEKLNLFLKLLVITACCVAASIGDWSFWAVLWILIFGLFRDNARLKYLLFGAIGVIFTGYCVLMSPSAWQFQLFQLGTLLAIPLFMLYNGEHGKLRLKWFFYLYYPVHLTVIALIVRA